MEAMKISDVKLRIEKLAEMAKGGDHEATGGEEHRIWEDVLDAIRRGHTRPKVLARVALMTKDVEFPRGW